MRRRNTRRHTLVYIAIAIIAGSVGLTLFGLSKMHSVVNEKSVVKVKTDSLAAPVQPNATVYSLPSRLIIPKLGVETNIIPMGITATGNMEAPTTNQVTGWYKYGARPGNVGTAVIDGHLGLSNEAVFGKLDQLAIGDTISVIDDQGSTISFIVKRIATYQKDSDATDIFTSGAGSHLNLITCNGDWDARQATYSQRFVVFSEVVTKAVQ